MKKPKPDGRALTTDGSAEPLMSRDELARLFGKTPRTISDWMRDGMPVAKSGGSGVQAFYLPSACVAWRIAAIEAKYAGMEGLNPVAERARKDRAQAEILEQTKAQRERKLVLRADVELEIGKRIGPARALWLALPRSVAPECAQVAARGGPEAVERLLRERVNEMLTNLAGLAQPL
jgi:phage terminase Nu1 subunit (DNA packaging protein)